jgi:uncharacterized protein (DUF1800 family)
MNFQEPKEMEMLKGYWAPYSPDDRVPWDLRRVVHLHRRAGFGATWGEIQRDLKEGPKAAVDRFLAGKAYSAGVPPDFEATAALLGDAATASKDPSRLKAWWIFRMLFGPDPLTERLTLMWHNHFATSNLKVDDLEAMRAQNEVFRKLGRAPFGELLNAMVRDKALLVWLDAPANRKRHPNENLAREMMELFTMGIGHYTEADVKEAARALTGLRFGVGGKLEEAPQHHDDGAKTILGKTGRWKCADLVRMLLESPATSERLAFRLIELFMGEGVVATDGVSQLATGLRERQLDVGWGVETILRSHAFFADLNLGRRVRAPIECVVGPVRALELFDPPPSTLVLGEWTTRLGQELFYPPNVGGWPGGRSWLSARSLVNRTHYATALIEGSSVGRPVTVHAAALAERHGVPARDEAILDFYSRLLFGQELGAGWQTKLLDSLKSDTPTSAVDLQRLLVTLLTSPQAQLS